MTWNLKELEKKFAGKLFGKKVCYYAETASTNDDAFSMGMAGAAEGTVVIADRQSRGRGRRQRLWHSPANVNLYTSLILRPQIHSFESSRIPIMAGVAVADVLESFCPGCVGLKWPNDVLLNHKKVCGILSQARIHQGRIDFIVLGIGINVNMSLDQFPEEIRHTATSLIMQTGREFSRQELLIRLYENLEKWYKQLTQNGFDAIRKKWLDFAIMMNQNIQVAFGNEIIEGRAKDIDSDGALILFVERNKEIKVSAGDATIIKR